MDKGKGMACHGRTEIKVQSETVVASSRTPSITRRGFLGFFLIGGLVRLFHKKVRDTVKIEDGPKEAMFWRKTDD